MNTSCFSYSSSLQFPQVLVSHSDVNPVMPSALSPGAEYQGINHSKFWHPLVDIQDSVGNCEEESFSLPPISIS